GAIAVYTLADKLKAGLQQLMAGVRKFSIPSISREDLFSANHETEEITGIPFITEAEDDIAKKILNS
ncbi:MAG: FMN-binding glutamate synthase family protein, partial [Endomicrobia bacterium]|nr:FMN-binding glutamate synthase family protein [Endomicrobiia bacterium]